MHDNKRIQYFLALIAAIALSIAVAWGASSYYGERRTGQEALLPPTADILTYGNFEWLMTREADVIVDSSHIANPRFEDGAFVFETVDDTYFHLNLFGQKIIAAYHFFVSLTARTERDTGWVSISVTHDGKHYSSENVRLPESLFEMELDLTNLKFYRPGDLKTVYRWGEDIPWADSLRLDWDGLDGTTVMVNRVRIRSGVRLDFNLADLQASERSASEGVEPHGRGIQLDRGTRKGIFVTPPIGIGTIDRFFDLHITGVEGTLSVSARTGNQTDQDSWDWKDWQDVDEGGNISSLPPDAYIQLRFNLLREDGVRPAVEGFVLRLLDSSPPGLGGPLFGSAHIPTLMPGRSISSLLRSSSHTVWVRLPFRNPEFETWIEDLVAADINVMVSISLDVVSREKVLETVDRYSSRILAWELYTEKPKGAQYFTDIYRRVRELNPMALIFPERISHDYFQDLALRGLAEFAREQGTPEEVLDRGFWWYFVVVLIGTATIIALGPVLGYNFHIGVKDIRDLAIGIAAGAVVLIPALYFTGLADLTLPRDFAQIRIAFSRYLLSAVFQEFLRALMLLLAVRYLALAHIEKRRAWLIAVGASSILFGLSHLGYPGFNSAEVAGFVVVTTLAGIIFGWVFYRTRSLVAVGVMHLLFNMFFATMTSVGPRM